MNDHSTMIHTPKQYQFVMYRGKTASVVSPTDYYPGGQLDLVTWDGSARWSSGTR